MAFVFTWAGALGLVAGLSALGVAALVFWTRPGRSQNRRLALLLSLDGVSSLGGAGLMYLTDSAASTWAWQALTPVFASAVPFAYLLFLATLDTPLARPLRHPIVDKGLVVGLLLAPSFWFRYPESFVAGVVPGAFSPWQAVPGGFGWWAMSAGLVSAAVVGLIFAISAWRRTEPGTARRSQARSYVLAFGVRDVGWLVIVPLFAFTEGGLGGPALNFTAGVILPGAVQFAFVLLLAYGILKTQLFDIDLRVKRGISRSTVAGTFGALFLVVSEGVEFLLGVEGTLYGLGAAVLVGLVFRRVEAAAQHVADLIMPGVEDTEEYREQRKVEVYRAAVEDAAGDEEVTAKERDVLDGLQDNLGLDGDEAGRIEADVLEADPTGGHPP